MKTTPLKKLKADYEECCNQYATKFANKQGLTFEGWVGDNIGGIACFGDYFFNLEQIRIDCDTKQPKGLILQWQNESIEAHFEKLETANMNYLSYIKGLRFK